MSTLKQACKITAEMCLLGTVARVTARRRHGQALVLAFHNVLPAGTSITGDRSLHLPERRFCSLLDAVQDVADIVPLSEILNPPVTSRPRVAITFDDAYRGCLQVAIPELVRRSLHSTVFVSPGFSGGGTFWWDALAGPSGLSTEIRSAGLETLKGLDGEVRTWAEEMGYPLTPLPQAYEAASEVDLVRATSSGHVTLGVHTWSHARLDVLREVEIEEELRLCYDWLKERFSSTIPWVSYPYGYSNQQVHETARALGLEYGLAVDGGWIDDNSEVMALPRWNVPAGVSTSGLRLRLAGLFTS